MSFLFGSSVASPLAETAGLNTRLFRKKRAAEVARLTEAAFSHLKTQIENFSASHVETSASFVFTEEPFATAVTGMKKVSPQERDLVIENVSALLTNEKFTVGSIPAGILVSWVVAPEPVVAQASSSPVVDGQVSEISL